MITTSVYVRHLHGKTSHHTTYARIRIFSNYLTTLLHELQARSEVELESTVAKACQRQLVAVSDKVSKLEAQLKQVLREHIRRDEAVRNQGSEQDGAKLFSSNSSVDTS